MSDIPADWLARYVTRAGIVIHPMILKDIEQRRGIPYPDSLLTYFSENRDGDDWKRISNAWRQKRHRDQRSNTLEALRNGRPKAESEALRNGSAYAEVMDGIRQNNLDLLKEIIVSIHGDGCGYDYDDAIGILQALRNAIDKEMEYLNKRQLTEG